MQSQQHKHQRGNGSKWELLLDKLGKNAIRLIDSEKRGNLQQSVVNQEKLKRVTNTEK